MIHTRRFGGGRLTASFFHLLMDSAGLLGLGAAGINVPGAVGPVVLCTQGDVLKRASRGMLRNCAVVQQNTIERGSARGQ